MKPTTHRSSARPRGAARPAAIDVRERARRLAWPLTLLTAMTWAALSPDALAETARDGGEASEPRREPVRAYPLDWSGRRQVGEASYYDDYFFGRKMANGEPMRPDSNNAASKTLPLGTKAQVKNLENGRTAVVEIKDRGPYIEGRIVDLSPSTAEALGITEQGVARVEVKPIELPPPKGSQSASSARKRGQPGDSQTVASAAGD